MNAEPEMRVELTYTPDDDERDVEPGDLVGGDVMDHMPHAGIMDAEVEEAEVNDGRSSVIVRFFGPAIGMIPDDEFAEILQKSAGDMNELGFEDFEAEVIDT